MNWTNEKPTKPGWYWYRDNTHDADKDKEIIELCEGGEVFNSGIETSAMISDLTGQFAGPIPEPVA